MARIRIEFRTPRRITAPLPYYGQQPGSTSNPGVSMRITHIRITYACCGHTVEIPLHRPHYRDPLVRVRCACDVDVGFIRREVDEVDEEMQIEEGILVLTSLQSDELESKKDIPLPPLSAQTTRQFPHPCGSELVGGSSTDKDVLQRRIILHLLWMVSVFCGLVYVETWIYLNVVIPTLECVGMSSGQLLEKIILITFFLAYVPMSNILSSLLWDVSLALLRRGLLWVFWMVHSLLEMAGDFLFAMAVDCVAMSVDYVMLAGSLVALAGSLMEMTGNLVVMVGEMVARAGEGAVAMVNAGWV